jgi:putative transposase
MVQRANNEFGSSIRVSCGAFGSSETCYQYQAKLSTENDEIADWLLQLIPFSKTNYKIY